MLLLVAGLLRIAEVVALDLRALITESEQRVLIAETKYIRLI